MNVNSVASVLPKYKICENMKECTQGRSLTNANSVGGVLAKQEICGDTKKSTHMRNHANNVKSV